MTMFDMVIIHTQWFLVIQRKIPQAVPLSTMTVAQRHRVFFRTRFIWDG